MSIHDSANTSNERTETVRNFLTSHSIINTHWYGDEPDSEPPNATLLCQHQLPESGTKNLGEIHRLFGGAFEVGLLISENLYTNLYNTNAPDISKSRLRATTWTAMTSD
ncbi:hypothetical protein QR685DRAFT_484010, partial [Neurospora intermedia]